MRLVSEGEDSLAKFEVHCPGLCGCCGLSTDIVLSYNGSMLAAALKKKGIDISKAKSLIIYDDRGSRKTIGVTCGCYAKFQRQLAHISDTRRAKAKG